MDELAKLNAALESLMNAYKAKISEIERYERITSSLEEENSNLKSLNKQIVEKLSKFENNSNSVNVKTEEMISRINGLLSGKVIDSNKEAMSVTSVIKENKTFDDSSSKTLGAYTDASKKDNASLSINTSRFDAILK